MTKLMTKVKVDTCSYRVSDHPVFTLYVIFLNHVGEHKATNYEGTDDCSSTAVTDNLFMHSAFITCNKNTFKLLS